MRDGAPLAVILSKKVCFELEVRMSLNFDMYVHRKHHRSSVSGKCALEDTASTNWCAINVTVTRLSREIS